MLNSLRSFASSPIGLIVFGLIILGLLAFGVSLGGRDNVVARVGSVEISDQDFADAYQNALNRYAQQQGRVLSPSQAVAIGFPDSVLVDLLRNAVIDDRVDRLGLGVSDETVAVAIAQEPAFRTSDGAFSQVILDNYLRSTGLTERELIEQERQQVLREQIARAIVSPDTPLPSSYSEIMSTFFTEQRVVEYAIIGPDNLEDQGVAEPTDEELEAYFTDNATRWQAPELRTVDLLELTPERLANLEAVTDTEVVAAYEARRDELGTPEERTVSQQIFNSRDEADRIAGLLADGVDYAELVENGEIEPTSLGTVARTALFDPAVRAAAFALEEGETDIVEGRSGATLVHVSEVIEGDVPELEEVADDIRQGIAEGLAVADVNTLFLDIEDARAAGLTLPEVAEQLDLAVETITVDANGNGPNGEPVDPLPGGNVLVTNVFESDVGLADAAIRLPGDAAYLWYEVTEVSPQRQRSLDEVRDQVTEAWRGDAVNLRIEAIAESMAALLRTGEPIEDIEAALGVSFQRSEALTRGSEPPEGTTALFVQAAFGGPTGFVTSVPAPDLGTIVLLVVESNEVDAEPGEVEAGVIADSTGTLLSQLVNSYVNDLADRERIFEVGINRSLMDQVVGLAR